jgi:hypothetical protein
MKKDIYNTKGTNFQRNGRSWRLGGYRKVTGIEYIYPRTKPPILEVGFSRQDELCEHFVWESNNRTPLETNGNDR